MILSSNRYRLDVYKLNPYGFSVTDSYYIRSKGKRFDVPDDVVEKAVRILSKRIYKETMKSVELLESLKEEWDYCGELEDYH